MLLAPEVGVVDDAAVFVLGDGVALHDPLDGGLAVHDVVVGFQRDVADCGGVIEDDGVLGRLAVHLGEAHFVGDAEGGTTPLLHLGGVRHGSLIAQVKLRELPAGLAECPEALDVGDAGEFLFEVILKAGAVLRAMEQAVDVVEDVLARDFGVVVYRPKLLECKVSDGIVASIIPRALL